MEEEAAVDPPVVSQVVTPPPEPPAVWGSFVTLAIALFVIVFFSCFLGSFFAIREDGTPLTSEQLVRAPGFLIAAMALTQGVLLLAVWKLPAFLDDVGSAGWQERVHWRPDRFSVIDIVVIALGAQVIGSISLMLLSLGDVEGGVLTGMAQASKSSDPSGFALIILVGAIAPGFAEELTFRGLLQTRLVERWGATAGVLISSVVFGVWHLDLRQGAMAIAMGAWLGWCAHRQKSIVNGAFAHVLSNALAFSVSRFQPSGGDVGGMGVAAAMGTVCVAIMWRRTRDSTRASVPAHE